MPAIPAADPSSWSDEYLLGQLALGRSAFADAQRWQAIVAELQNRGLTLQHVDSFAHHRETERGADRLITVELVLSAFLLCFGIGATALGIWFCERGHGSSQCIYGIWYGAVLVGLGGLGHGLLRLWRRRHPK